MVRDDVVDCITLADPVLTLVVGHEFEGECLVVDFSGAIELEFKGDDEGLDVFHGDGDDTLRVARHVGTLPRTDGNEDRGRGTAIGGGEPRIDVGALVELVEPKLLALLTTTDTCTVPDEGDEEMPSRALRVPLEFFTTEARGERLNHFHEVRITEARGLFRDLLRRLDVFHFDGGVYGDDRVGVHVTIFWLRGIGTMPENGGEDRPHPQFFLRGSV
jgi:hypothetical protein